MTSDEYKISIFGLEHPISYSEEHVGYSLFLTRIIIGWIFLQAGLEKIVNPWSAAGYLNNVPAGNPFIGFWHLLAGSPAVDFLVIAGLTLIGIGLISGALFRFSAFWGSVMMLLFWASSLHGGLMQGLPLEHGWAVNSHIVYIFLLTGLSSLGAGRIAGVDYYIEKLDIIDSRSKIKYLLG